MRRTGPIVVALTLMAGTAAAGRWEPLGPPGVLPTRLAADPGGTAVAFAGGGLWVSRDGGATWAECPLPPTSVLDLLFDPAHPGDLLALVEGWPGLGDRPALVAGHEGGREWSVRWAFPGGATARVMAPDPWVPGAVVVGGQIGETGVFRLDPGGGLEPLALLPGGVADLAAVPGRALWVLPPSHPPLRSTDGGRSWTAAADPSSGAQYTIAADPFGPDTVVVGDDAAISTSTDAGRTWSYWPAGGPVRRIAFSRVEPGLAWAATASALLRSTDSGRTWRRMPLRDGSYADVLPDPADPAGVWLAATAPPRGIPWPGVLRSDDGGRTVRLATEGLAAVPVGAVLPSPDGSGPELVARTPTGDVALEAGAWRPVLLEGGARADALARDPHDGARLFAAAFVADEDTYGDTVFLSEDGGASWRRVAAPVPRAWFFELAPDPTDPARILAAGRFGVFAFDLAAGDWTGVLAGEDTADTVAFFPGLPGVALAAGSELGAVYRSTDHGATWTRAAAPDLPWWSPWRLVPAAGGRAFLHSAAGDGTVLVSDDAGDTWRPVPLPAPGCGPPAPAPGAPDDLVVACAPTRRGWGLYRTTDGGRSWRAVPGPPGLAAATVARDPADPEVLLVGTARHGVWRGRLPAAARRPAGRLPIPRGAVTALTRHGEARH